MDALKDLPEDNLYIFRLINFLVCYVIAKQVNDMKFNIICLCQERFVAQVESYGFSNHDVCKKLRLAGNELIGEYRVRLNKQIMIW
jgi:hypothetical protein